MLSSCTAIQVRDQPTFGSDAFVAVEHPDTLSALVAYVKWLRKLPPEQQAQAVAALDHEQSVNPSPFGQVRLALLLSLPGAPFGDEARARSILQHYQRARASGGAEQDDNLSSFATLLQWSLQERAQLQGQTAEAERQLSAERKARDTLQHQLNELKAIEQKLNQRDQPQGILR